MRECGHECVESVNSVIYEHILKVHSSFTFEYTVHMYIYIYMYLHIYRCICTVYVGFFNCTTVYM